MATAAKPSLTVVDLARLLKTVEPAALLVAPRLLRRVIKHDRGLGGMGLIVPHRKSYVIAADALMHLADRTELGLAANEMLPPRVILMARPEADSLSKIPIDEALVKYWRMLFHARLDLLMQTRIADNTLNARTVRQRIGRLGTTEFAEVTRVMEEEKFLLPPKTPASIYAEFVAVYWTLRRFNNELLPHFFPSLRDLAAVDALLSGEVDVDGVFAGTRLPGAPEPGTLQQRGDQTDEQDALSAELIRLDLITPVGDNTARRIEVEANDMNARGNNVRAAILRARLADGNFQTLASARAELGRLSQRLQKALALSEEDVEKWRHALTPLLTRACRGSWSQEARFLYDLQKVCIDSERGIFTVDVVEWVRSLGRRPIRRELPGHQAVAIVRHLRQALNRMPHVRLAEADREELSDVLTHAVAHHEQLMRERFRPLIAAAMDDVNLKPENVPEVLARSKLIEELLDRVVEYGHLNMGNLRDAISRNQLKLPDVGRPSVLIMGDPLLRLNRRLSVDLDGVYRPGEIYMRLLHRVSSVAFGTVIGRLLMLFLIVPFGLAFFTMVAPELVVEEVPRIGYMMQRVLGLVDHMSTTEQRLYLVTSTAGLVGSPLGDGPLGAAAAAFPGRVREHHPLQLPDPWGVAVIGAVYLLLFHVTAFRRGVFHGVGTLGRGLQTVFIHGPLLILRHPMVQAVLNYRFWVTLRRCVVWPVALATIAALLAWLGGAETMAITALSSGGAVVALLLFNTRFGRDVEEKVSDWMMHAWLWCTGDFVPGLLRFIMDLSRGFLETVEQVLYTVDEWLRFKTGQNVVILVAKALLSVVWFAVTYVVRIYINVLIEPTVNPIKHFPVVTVGHKLLVPFYPIVWHLLYRVLHLDLLGRLVGYSFAVMTIFFIPGIFGFVVWELKENWKLYRANRARNLKPLMVGSHGETMLRLLKPGFHSGTIPKLLRKLRRAERRGQQRTTRKLQGDLHHVEESVGLFVERELLALLRQSEGWHGLSIELGSVHLATNRITVALQCPELAQQPLVLAFDQQLGWLLASVLERGWLPRLNAEQKQTLAAALAGLYKMAGVHLTREQIAVMLAPTPVALEMTPEGLGVWPGPDFSREAVYNLAGSELLQPRPTNGELPHGLRPLDSSRVLFSSVPLSWRAWVRTWDRDKGLLNGDRRELAYAVLP
jgi:hypothetical protein